MRQLCKLILFVVLQVSLAAALAQSSPIIELTVGFHRVEAEVAATHAARAQGLMHRKEMPVQRGMLFVFPDVAVQCMWMRNTLIPLAVAFLDESGRILNVAEMKPHSEENHCAVKPVRYALEMNSGWFGQRGLKNGAVISGIERAGPAR